MTLVTDTLGRTREAKVYPDTSYNCPFCMAAVMAGSPAHAAHKCPNPGCYSRGGVGMPPYPPEKAREDIEREVRRKKEIEERIELERWRREYAEERRNAEEERLATIQIEAMAKGACVPCAIESARWRRTPKFTKHRKGCPRSKR